MSRNGKLIARATARAYASAIAEGADPHIAFETACALYRQGHPRIRESILRRVVQSLVRLPVEVQATGPAAEYRGVISAQNAYVRAISGGAAPHVAFDVARAAYRALYPGLSGATLDTAVAQVLASRTIRPAGAGCAAPAPGDVRVEIELAAADGPGPSGGLKPPPTLR